MAAKSIRFSVILVCLIAATIFVKASVTFSVQRPFNEDIAKSVTAPLERQGFQVAGLSEVAGRTALLAMREACTVYVVPVSEHGWHEAVMQRAVGVDQALWFLFDGVLYRDVQPRWKPLMTYYLSVVYAYAGLQSQFHPVYALLADSQCKLDGVDWSALPTVPFRFERFNLSFESGEEDI